MTTHNGAKQLPLTGVRVLDMSRVMSGPYCALLLSEMGAEVIKIESPGKAEPSRQAGSPVGFSAWNLNKRSLTLNMYEEEAKGIFKELLKLSDIVVENFRPGIMKAMGLDYPVLEQLKPSIVLTSITGYGPNTSLANYTAHNGVIVAFSGLTDMNRYGDFPPINPPDSAADAAAGTYAALGTVAALYQARVTGRGQHIDMSMVDGLVGQIGNEISRAIAMSGGEKPTDGSRFGLGTGTSYGAFHRTYKCKDGYVYLQCDIEEQWRRFCRGIGRPELIDDPRLQGRGRRQHAAELDAIFGEWVKDRTKAEIFEHLGGSGVPVSPVNSVTDIAYHPYLKERGIIHEVGRTPEEKQSVISPRIQFESVPVRKPTIPPALGEHTDEVLRSLLGYDKRRLDDLRSRGII